MICNDKFSFIHLHKTAGQSINEILLSCIPSAKFIGYHYPCSKIPHGHRHQPLVGVIRNPWDWYVSWYAFNSIGGIKNPLFNIVSRGRQLDFKHTLINLLRYPDASQESVIMREAHRFLLPSEFSQELGSGFTAACINSMKSNTDGYYGALVKRMFGHPTDQTLFARFDDLEESLSSILTGLNVSESNLIKSRLKW